MVKNSPANAGDTSSISGSGRSPKEGHGNPLQYSFLENSMDRGDWWGHKESDMTELLTHNGKNLSHKEEKSLFVLRLLIFLVSGEL